MIPARRKKIRELLKKPHFKINKISNVAYELYDQALTHSSYAKEMQDKNMEYRDNERLEFLGNFVLGLVASEYLYGEFEYSEGEMTKRMEVVSDAKLAEVIRKHKVGFEDGVIRLGKRRSIPGGKLEDSILAGALEAVIGAIYLDQGMEKIRTIILGLLADEVKNFDPKKNFIGRLQEFIQKKKMGELKYIEKKITGPDHRPTFRAIVEISQKKYGQGTGKNKKAAKMKAAEMTLKLLEKKDRK